MYIYVRIITPITMKRIIASIIAITSATLIAVAANTSSEPLKMTPKRIRIDTYEASVSANLIIVQPEAMPDVLDPSVYTVEANGTERKVTGVYRCDERGEFNAAGQYLAFGLEFSRRGSPMVYDGKTGFNNWVKAFPVSISLAKGKSIKVGGVKYSAIDCASDNMIPGFISESDIMTRGTYTGPSTGLPQDETIATAAYEPWELLSDGKKNPLIIWLHGMGEGGTDPRIVLMGNETISLIRDGIQSHFTTDGGADGAYVLVLQSPTMWMDSMKGMSMGDVPSRYSDVLFNAILDYVTAKNPDVDPSRIYVGGCSNGGYMTMNLLLRHPKFFAAAYPVCEAYSDSNISDAEITYLANENIWFVQAFNDTTVKPQDFGMATYDRLMEKGAKNVWYSMFEDVTGSDIPGAKYMGHFSWVYVFNDEVTASQEQKAGAWAPSNNGGGSIAPQGHANLFDWMNAQRR